MQEFGKHWREAREKRGLEREKGRRKAGENGRDVGKDEKKGRGR